MDSLLKLYFQNEGQNGIQKKNQNIYQVNVKELSSIHENNHHSFLIQESTKDWQT